MLKKIAITGPESTGKTSLSKGLALHYKDIWVPEVARTYIDELSHSYNVLDLDIIAEKQITAVQVATHQANNFLFADTELTVIKIWYENAFKTCPDWILNALEHQYFDLYLLPDIDLPWTYDPQREHPHLRTYFFNLYKQELETRNRPYEIIKGTGEERMNNAVRAVERFFKI